MTLLLRYGDFSRNHCSAVTERQQSSIESAKTYPALVAAEGRARNSPSHSSENKIHV